jgi:SWI/SNF-related matrix-associated actin-dependent regulator of chromatin subfamily A member 5
MPKEDRSDWVAVAPEFAESSSSSIPKIRPASSAYQFFQKDVTEEAKKELIEAEGKFEVGKFSRLVRDRWNQLGDEEKEKYEAMAREDAMRFASESHAADVAAMERKEKLRRERETLILDDEGGDKRKTRGQRRKSEKKKARKEQRRKRKGQDDSDENDGDSSESYQDDGSSSSDSYDSDDSDAPKKRKPKPKPAPRKVSQKQIEYRNKVKEEKAQKEKYIVERQDDLRKEKADQAKRRLMFLLKQSSIFSHFGAVKEDQAKYGIKQTKRSEGDGQARRSANGEEGDEVDAADLDQGDQSQAVFLTSQPTTLGFGKMRPYQLEGLNWMIRLQENGVNGILADEMGLVSPAQFVVVIGPLFEFCLSIFDPFHTIREKHFNLYQY